MITLRTLGECLVEVDGTLVAPDADRAFALLVLLTAERGRPLPRATLAAWLWPERPAGDARHCLRQALYRLRALGVTPHAVRDALVLPADAVAPTFAAAPDAARLRAARRDGALRLGPALPGWAPRVHGECLDWLDTHRAQLEGAARTAALEVLADDRRRGAWGEAAVLARGVLRLDPLQDVATLTLAEAEAMLGRPHAAVATVDRYLEELGPDAAAPLVRRARALRRAALALPGSPDAPPPLVGREVELARLTTAWRAAAAGRGEALALHGAAGSGKSRLLDEAVRLATLDGARVVRVAALPGDEPRAAGTLSALVAALLACPGALGCAPESLAWLRRLAGAPTPAPVEAARAPTPLAGRLRAALVDLLDAVAAEAPLLVALDDAHHADATSRAALPVVARAAAGRPVLLLLACASDAPPDVPLPGERLAVRPLAPGAADALVAALHDALDAEARAWCMTVGAGLPLALVEAVRHLREGGRPDEVPPSVRALVGARLARLRPGVRQLLQALAVLGPHATPARAARLLERPTHAMLHALHALSRAGLVVVDGGTVRPAHALAAALVLDDAPPAGRLLLHARAAAVLEAEAPPDGHRDRAVIEHWLAAGEASRALAAAHRAARTLLDVGGPRDAAGLLARVLAAGAGAAADARTVAALRTLHAEALLLAGDPRGARAALDGVPEDDGDGALVRLEAEWATGEPWDALLVRARALAVAAGAPADVRLRAALLAVALAENGASDDPLADVRAAIDAAAHGDPGLVLRARMIHATSAGALAEGLRAAHQLADRLLAAPVGPGELLPLQNAAEALRVGGDARAAAVMERAFEAAARWDAAALAARAADRLAVLALDHGAGDAARAWSARSAEWAARAAADGPAWDVADTRTRLALAAGDMVAARAGAAELRARLAATAAPTPRLARAVLTTALEVALHEAGTPDAALVDALLLVHARTCRRTQHDRTVRALAAALTRAGDVAGAERLVRRYLRDERRGAPGVTAAALLPAVTTAP